MTNRFLVFLSLILSGCSVYKIERVPYSPGYVEFKTLQPSDSAEPKVTLRQSTNRFMEGFQCFEPMLTVLSIGIIPGHCVQSYQAEVASSIGSVAPAAVQNFEVDVVFGWLAALLMAPLPDWQFGEESIEVEITASAREVAQ